MSIPAAVEAVVDCVEMPALNEFSWNNSFARIRQAVRQASTQLHNGQAHLLNCQRACNSLENDWSIWIWLFGLITSVKASIFQSLYQKPNIKQPFTTKSKKNKIDSKNSGTCHREKKKHNVKHCNWVMDEWMHSVDWRRSSIEIDKSTDRTFSQRKLHTHTNQFCTNKRTDFALMKRNYSWT